MPELQLALVVLAILVLIGVYCYTIWQERRRPGSGRPISVPGRESEPRPSRRPSLDPEDLPAVRQTARRLAEVREFEEPVTSRRAEPGSLDPEPADRGSGEPGEDPARESAGDSAGGFGVEEQPGSAGGTQEPRPEAGAQTDAPEEVGLDSFDPDQQKIIVLHVMGPETGLPGDRLRSILESERCRHGQYNIFHRAERGEDGRPGLVFSIADLVEPGEFDLTEMDASHYRGVTLFAVLPGPLPGTQAFRTMLNTASRIAEELEGEVRDELRNPLSHQRATHIEEEVVEFERLRLQALRNRSRS